jgi:hypothetical protein
MKASTPLFGLVAVIALLGVCVAGQNETAPELTARQVDRLIQADWNRENIVPSPPVDDAGYLRRISLDITGTLPTEQMVRAFLTDRSPDKRRRAVDALLDTPAYAEHWTNYWDSVLLGKQYPLAYVDRPAFRQWLHDQFARNTPWDKLVYSLITATGYSSPGGDRRSRMLAMYDDAGQTAPARAMSSVQSMPEETPANSSAAPGGAPAVTIDPTRVNGAVNYLLKFRETPADLAGTTSRVFLGVQIQCAQCHDHKTEKWKQTDFRSFTACFMQARPKPIVRASKGVMAVLDIEDVNVPMRPRQVQRLSMKQSDLASYLSASPAALDGTRFAASDNRRRDLASWITSKDNPWFAEAIVNRIWSHFLGRGFVEPIDDFRPSNPPVAPEVLKRIADDFRANGCDLKRLIRLVCATQVYQLSSAPARRADHGNLYWERYRLKPMGPDELLDSLVQATDFGAVLERVAGERLDRIKLAMHRQFTFLFDVDEEFEQKEFEGTITQALMLMNGNLTNRSVTPVPGAALAEVLAMPGGDADRIESLYLRTLSRPPTPAETNYWTGFVNAPRTPVMDSPQAQQAQQAQNEQPGFRAFRRNGGAPARPARLQRLARVQAYEDLFWALLNSSEFMFNH